MNYIGETKRQKEIQADIEFEIVCGVQVDIARISKGMPWRLVDNREAYIKKRMALEGMG